MNRLRIGHNLPTAGRQRRDTDPVTQTGEDFEEFVAARWPELHAVATITTADAVHATTATATALATLQGRWAELTSSGAPTGAARTAVLTAALRAARRTTPRPPPGPTDTQGVDTVQASATEPAVRAAMTAALAGAPATARAALAVDLFWGEDDTTVAACARRDPATVHRDHAALLTQLAAAHAAALGRDEAELVWALPAAIADTLTHLADSAPTANPLTEVRAARARATRSRALRAGAVAVALAAAGAAVLAWTSPEPVPTLPADSPAWAVVSSWTPRGPLVGDSDVAALAATAAATDPGAHLLYAGPVGDTTVVLMTATGDTGPDPAMVPDGGLGERSNPTRNVELKMWTAPAGADPATLTATPIPGNDSHAAPVAADTVAVSIPQRAPAGGHAVLVMTPPTVTEGSATTGARAQPDGTFRPLVQALKLRGGVATFSEAPRIPALLEVNRYNGLPAGATYADNWLPARGEPDELAAAQARLLAAAGGYTPDTLTSVTADAMFEMSDPEFDIPGNDPVPVQVAVVTTATPDGGWVRTSRWATTDPNSSGAVMEELVALPADDHTYALLPVGDPSHPAYIALAGQAATAQLVTTDGKVRDTAPVKDGMALLGTTLNPATTTFKLRLLAPDGRTLYDQVPPTGNSLRSAPSSPA